MANGFGDLNPRDIDTRTREITNDTRGLDYIRDSAILANANKANSLKSTGPYLAEVLKVFTSAEDKQAFKSASGFNLWGSVDSKPTGEIVTIIARIPEIHHYDLPSKLPLNPDNPNYRKDVKIVDMYPRFVAQKAGLPIPKVGQTVWVDFEDKVSYSGGIYLGTLDSTEVVSNAPDDGSTIDAWKNGMPFELGGYNNFAPNGGTTITEMFKMNPNGRIFIRKALAEKRWVKLKQDLEQRLNEKMPGQNWKVPIRGHGTRRELSKAAATKNPLRAAGSLHGVGLADDFRIISSNYPDGYGAVENQNKKLIKNKEYLNTVNDFINEQPDIWWGAYIRKGDIVTEEKYYDATRPKGHKREFQQLYSGELHHFEIHENYYAAYYAPWQKALNEINITKIPQSSEERQEFYKRVIEHFNLVAARNAVRNLTSR